MNKFSISIVALLLAQPVFGQEEAAEEAAVDDGTQSGYDDVKEFGGPEGISQSLKRDDETKETTFQFDGLQRGLKPYFDWKRRINDEHGVSLGAQLYVLYQDASSSLGGRDSDAFGNIQGQRQLGPPRVARGEPAELRQFPGAGFARFGYGHCDGRSRLRLLR
jgi:hypothetical protein